MYPTIRVLSSRGHQPLIKFLGKRTYPSAPSTPRPHPVAPVELKQKFAEFINKFEASDTNSEASNGKAVFSEFWQAPERFWKREMGEIEINAILSGGASLR